MSLFPVAEFWEILVLSSEGFGVKQENPREPHYSPGSHIMDSAHKENQSHTRAERKRRILFTCRTPYTDWI